MSGVFLLCPFYILKGLSFNLEFINLTGLASQCALGIPCFHLPMLGLQMHVTTMCFYMVLESEFRLLC